MADIFRFSSFALSCGVTPGLSFYHLFPSVHTTTSCGYHRNSQRTRDYPGTNSDQLTKDGKYQPGSLIWSPDGTKIACVRDGEVRIINVSDKTQQPLKPDAPIEPIPTISDWSSDGNKLLVISGDEPRAYTIDVRTNQTQLLLKDKKGLCSDAVWSRDGSKVLYVTSNFDRTELWMANADGTKGVALLTKDIDPNAKFINAIVWSKDTSAVLFEGSDQFFGADDRKIIIMRMEVK